MFWRSVSAGARAGTFGFALFMGLSSSIGLLFAGLSSSIGLLASGLASSLGIRPLLPPLLSISFPIPVPDDLGTECNWLVEVLHSWELFDFFEVLRDLDPGLALPPYPLRVTHGASCPLDDASVGSVEDVSV